MTTASLRRNRLDVVVTAALVATGAGLVGVVAGADVSLAVLALVAAGFGAVTLWRPFVGVLLLVAIIPLENVFIVTEGMTAVKAAGAAVFALWLLRKVVTGESWRHLTENGFVHAAAAFVLLAFLSLIWATNVAVAQRGAFQLAMLLAWGLLLLDLVRSWERADLLVRVLVAGGFVAAGLTVQQSFSGARRAGDMIAGGINATSVVLLSIIPFAFYLLRASTSTLWRFIGFIYIPMGVVALTMTYARLSFILLPPLLVLLFWQAIRDGRSRGLLLVFLIVSAIGISAVVPWDRVVQRAATIAPYLHDSAAIGETGPEVYSGRGYHLRIGLAIARDNPILGVGYRNYGELFRDEYQYVVGGTTYVYRSHRSPHSTYIGILADLGIIGTLLWLLVLGVAVRNGFRAWMRLRHGPRSPPFVFVQCLMVIFVVHVLAYGWYTPSQQDKLFWLILSLTAVLPYLFDSVNVTKRGQGNVTPQFDTT